MTFKSSLGLSLFENTFWFKEFQHPLNNLHNLRDCEVGNCAKVQVWLFLTDQEQESKSCWEVRKAALLRRLVLKQL